MSGAGGAHRASWLKQTNKKHKSFQRTTTNSAAKRRDNGKVEAHTGVESVKSSSIAAHLNQRKADKKNAAKQRLRAQRDAQQRQARGNSAPRLVMIVSLNESNGSIETATRLLPQELLPNDSSAAISWPVTFWDALEKSRITLQPTARRVDSVLAHAQTADLILFCLPVVAPSAPADGLDDDDDHHHHHHHHHYHDHDDGQSVASVLTTAVSSARQSGDGLIDDKGLLLLSMLKGQGLPPCMVALSGLEALPIGKRSGARKRAAKCVEYHFGTDIKFFPLDNTNDARLVMRHIMGSPFEPPSWRRTRPYVVATTRDREHAPAFFVERDNGELFKLNDHSVAQQALHAAAVAWGAHLEFAPSPCEALLTQFVAGVGGHVSDPPQSSLLLSIEGFLRGAALSPDDLVHVSGVGDFQLHSIEVLADPHPSAKMQRHRETQATVDLRFVPNASSQESLQQFNVPDPTLGEQTWPTEEELAEAEKVDTEKKKLRRLVPRGTSAYQAAWIVDDYGYADDDDDENVDDEDGAANDDDDGDDGQGKQRASAREDVAELDLVPLDEEDARLNPPPNGWRSRAKQIKMAALRRENLDDVSDEEDFVDEDDDGDDGGDASETGTLRSMRDDGLTLLERLDRRANDDSQWPDEVDIRPYEIARDIFRGWRGLRSFRDTPWDPYENLPPEYARVYQFAAFSRLTAILRREQYKKPVSAGQYVRLMLRVPLASRVASTTYCRLSAGSAELAELRQVDAHQVAHGEYDEAPDRRVPLLIALIDSLLDASASPTVLKPASSPFVVGGLLRHERKVSVMHCMLKRHQSYASIVRNGEPLVVQVGFRSLLVRPVFSAHDLGVDKHKYDRFLQRGVDTVATFYAPVCIGPAPVVVLQHELNAEIDCVAADGFALVGVGSVLKPDTNRVVVRKAVLTGVPIRCNKRSAVVATMFHNAEDVNYFKPIEMWTRHGRSGHILESKGTHGRMKCIFDGVLQQNDTVCMSLYARQFPPWPYADAELRQDAELFAGSSHVPLVRNVNEAHGEIADEEVDVPVGFGPVAGGK